MARKPTTSDSSSPDDGELFLGWVSAMGSADIRRQLDFLSNLDTGQYNKLRDSLGECIDKILNGRRPE